MRCVVALVLLCSLVSAAEAQTPTNPGDQLDPQLATPAIKNFNYRDATTVEPFPSGENQSGKGWSWNFHQQKMVFEFPKFALGVGSLSGSGGVIALVQNVFTPLDTTPDASGFRGGLAQTVPQGTWYEEGQVSFATHVTNSTYQIEITQGTTESDPTNQKHIYVGSPIVIGGGLCSSPAVSDTAFQCSFRSPKFQCVAPPGWACEIRVKAYTTDPPGSNAFALASSSQLGSTNVSIVNAIRVGGLDAEQ